MCDLVLFSLPTSHFTLRILPPVLCHLAGKGVDLKIYGRKGETYIVTPLLPKILVKGWATSF